MQIDGCRFCCSSQHGGAQCKRVVLKFPDVRRLYLCDTRLRRHTSLREWMRMAARAGSVHHCGRCSSVGGAGILQFVGGVTTQAVTSANSNGKRTQRKYNMQFVNQYGVWKVLQPTWQLVEALRVWFRSRSSQHGGHQRLFARWIVDMVYHRSTETASFHPRLPGVILCEAVRQAYCICHAARISTVREMLQGKDVTDLVMAVRATIPADEVILTTGVGASIHKRVCSPCGDALCFVLLYCGLGLPASVWLFIGLPTDVVCGCCCSEWHVGRDSHHTSVQDARWEFDFFTPIV